MSTDDVLAALADADGSPRSTPEVADVVEVSQRAAWVYLTRLAEDGLVDRHPGRDLKMDTWTLTEAGQSSVEE
ncbi:MAG: hypothetical protein U5J98_05400 [Halobacteriales archaeon]|nr:hypothetical protein [Halobacteriales archaeon]